MELSLEKWIITELRFLIGFYFTDFKQRKILVILTRQNDLIENLQLQLL